MSNYVIKNRAKQPIICTLGDGTSLRLPIDATQELTEKQYKGHVERLVELGDLSLEKTNTEDGTKVVKATVEQTGQQKSKGGK